MSKKSADDKPVAGGAAEKTTRKVTVSQDEEMEEGEEVEDGEESESGDEMHWLVN